MSDTAKLTSLCEGLLRRKYPKARVSGSVLLKVGERSRVLRIELDSGPAPTLVAKQILSTPDLGFSDYASHEFLSSLGACFAPQFVMGDPDNAFFVLADLGEFNNLMGALPGDDTENIEHIVRRLGTTMAELVAATSKREPQWNELRAELPAMPGPNRHDEAKSWRGGWRRAERWLGRIDVAMPQGLDALLDDLARSYVAPTHLAFSQGDPAPSNHTLRGGRCRLVDFEYGAYRHALHDLAQWHIRCPLSDHLFEILCTPFKEQLIGCVFADPDEFERELVLQATFAAIYMYMWIPAERALDADFPRVGSWSQRDALICTSRRLAALAAKLPMLAPARLLAETVLDRLGSLWPGHGDGEIDWRQT